MTAVNDQRVNSADALIAAVRSHAPGEQVKVSYTRGGKQHRHRHPGLVRQLRLRQLSRARSPAGGTPTTRLTGGSSAGNLGAMATHEVFNVPAPWLGANLFSADRGLTGRCSGPAWPAEDFERLAPARRAGRHPRRPGLGPAGQH